MTAASGQTAVGETEVTAFARDGVLCLRQAFGPEWIELLQAGFEENLAALGLLARDYIPEATEGRFLFDAFNWSRFEAFHRFVHESPAAELAARVMGSRTARLHYDTIFYRSAGTQARSPWHQDIPYWSFAGRQACSIWMPLVPVAKESALALVPGSHLWPQRFARPGFSDNDADNPNSDLPDYEPFPDIDADPGGYGVVSWDMAPGDCIAFDANIVHGGSGRLAADRELRVFATNWLGDDVVLATKPGGMDIDVRAIAAAYGLKEGDPPDCPAFPLAWPRG
jgi:ectoine hydroxylase-related dioxygenase (phytanoyl-CoA dioxygenase family)